MRPPVASCLPLCPDVAGYAADKGDNQSARQQNEIALDSNDRFRLKVRPAMSCGAYADKGLLPSGHRKAPARAQVRHCGSAPVPATGALVKHGSSTQPLPGDSCYCWPVVLSALFSGQAPLHVCQPWPFLSRMAGAQPRCGWWRKPGLSPNPQCLLPPNTLINCFGVSILLSSA